ncbi:sodium-dependent transporter [candidate division WOR-3 bacterium]|uniref:Sodium-dependent transporter n=1 Tax=candidate division WOR-3 bacterium TaxID=2052148 RepID=A0A9D5KAN0_UNCW3|nr:sodium-dependent transporter [candidate division WOR-3 bacterium]MBD3365195.1 sodium-dependent transporter [candidate division WOR-3 bacterium]
MAKHTFWDNRTAFILASIGSAIGLGNIWRFPYIAYKFGGGAFLIPYLVALLTAGIPLLILEFSLGHKMRSAAPNAFYKARKNTEWVGWFALLVGFGIVTYYAVIMAWSGRYLIASFNQGWGTTPQAVHDFFYTTVLGAEKAPDVIYKAFEIKRLMWPLLIILAVAWVWVLLSIWKGAKTVSKVVWITVVLPWLILLIFLIRGVTLPGAADGLRYFLTPNLEALKNPEVWHAAYSQVFFSLTVGFGVMIAYASFLPKKSDVINNAIIIGLADAGTAFAGGIVVFSTLGYYAGVTGQPVAQVVDSGPGLAFVTYPMIINTLPFGKVFIIIFGVLFFLMLLTLAVDSAFSLVEGGAAGLLDRFGWKRWKTLIGIAVVALIVGLIYITNAGLYWLDMVDNFMNNFGLFIVALLECIVVGWVWRAHHLRRYSNLRSEVKVGRWWEGMVQWIIPAVTIFILIFTVIKHVKAPYGGDYIGEFLGGWLLIGLFAEIAVVISRMKWRIKIMGMLIPPVLIGTFYGLRFIWMQSHAVEYLYPFFQTKLFILLWWIGVAVVTEVVIFLTRFSLKRKIVLAVVPPLILAAVYAIAWAWQEGYPQIVILIVSCLVLYGGIALALFRSARHQRKLKLGHIKPPPDDDEED